MSNLRRGVVTALILCAAVLGPATAQDKPRLQILVESPGSDVGKCGLTKAGMESTAILTLRNNGILTAPRTAPILYVNIKMIFFEIRRLCVGSVRVAVQSLGERKVGAFTVRQGEYPTNRLCSESGLRSSPSDEAERDFSEAIEQHIKGCLSQLEY